VRRLPADSGATVPDFHRLPARESVNGVRAARRTPLGARPARRLANGAKVPLVFITGPVRSGKSRLAERIAGESGSPVVYLATARRDPADAEWEARLARHAALRPAGWRVVETAEPGAPDILALVRDCPPGTALVLESLGTWLASRMSARFYDLGDEEAAQDALALEKEGGALVEALLATRAGAIVVGEEVGWSVVPEYVAGRIFRDVMGRLQQRLAAGAERAYLVVDGMALDLRTLGTPV